MKTNSPQRTTGGHPATSKDWERKVSTAKCEHCKEDFEQYHPWQAYCSAACRQRAYRKRKRS